MLYVATTTTSLTFSFCSAGLFSRIGNDNDFQYRFQNDLFDNTIEILLSLAVEVHLPSKRSVSEGLSPSNFSSTSTHRGKVGIRGIDE
jgi:hypothetical protein